MGKKKEKRLKLLTVISEMLLSIAALITALAKLIDSLNR